MKKTVRIKRTKEEISETEVDFPFCASDSDSDYGWSYERITRIGAAYTVVITTRTTCGHEDDVEVEIKIRKTSDPIYESDIKDSASMDKFGAALEGALALLNKATMEEVE